MDKGRVLRLRGERLRRGWTQTDVTLLTRLPQPAISAIERGMLGYVPPEWRRRLAKAFGLPEAELFSEEQCVDALHEGAPHT